MRTYLHFFLCFPIQSLPFKYPNVSLPQMYSSLYLVSCRCFFSTAKLCSLLLASPIFLHRVCTSNREYAGAKRVPLSRIALARSPIQSLFRCRLPAYRFLQIAVSRPTYLSASKRYGIYWSMVYWKTNMRLGLPSPSTGSIAFFPVSSVAYWVRLQPQWWSAIARRQTMDSLGFLILRTRGLKIRCFSS